MPRATRMPWSHHASGHLDDPAPRRALALAGLLFPACLLLAAFLAQPAALAWTDEPGTKHVTVEGDQGGPATEQPSEQQASTSGSGQGSSAADSQALRIIHELKAPASTPPAGPPPPSAGPEPDQTNHGAGAGATTPPMSQMIPPVPPVKVPDPDEGEEDAGAEPEAAESDPWQAWVPTIDGTLVGASQAYDSGAQFMRGLLELGQQAANAAAAWVGAPADGLATTPDMVGALPPGPVTQPDAGAAAPGAGAVEPPQTVPLPTVAPRDYRRFGEKWSVLPVYFVQDTTPLDGEAVKDDSAAIETTLRQAQIDVQLDLGVTFNLLDLVVVQALHPPEHYGMHPGANVYDAYVNDRFEGDVVPNEAAWSQAVRTELWNRGLPTPPKNDEEGYIAAIYVEGAGHEAWGNGYGPVDGGFTMIGDFAVDGPQGLVPAGAFPSQLCIYRPDQGRWWEGMWAHEFGHALDLGHVKPQLPLKASEYVMNPFGWQHWPQSSFRDAGPRLVQQGSPFLRVTLPGLTSSQIAIAGQ